MFFLFNYVEAWEHTDVFQHLEEGRSRGGARWKFKVRYEPTGRHEREDLTGESLWKVLPFVTPFPDRLLPRSLPLFLLYIFALFQHVLAKINVCACVCVRVCVRAGVYPDKCPSPGLSAVYFGSPHMCKSAFCSR